MLMIHDKILFLMRNDGDPALRPMCTDDRKIKTRATGIVATTSFPIALRSF
jgi:hypothetical protein